VGSVSFEVHLITWCVHWGVTLSKSH